MHNTAQLVASATAIVWPWIPGIPTIGPGVLSVPEVEWGWEDPRTYATFDHSTLTGDFSISNWNLILSKGQSWIHSYWYSTISKSSWKWYFEISSITWFWQLWIEYAGWKYWIHPGALKLQNEYWVASYWYYWADAFATNPTVVGFMLDLDNNEISFTLNWANQWVAFSLPAWEYKVYIKDIATWNYVANFWATPFAYPIPSGYNSWLYT